MKRPQKPIIHSEVVSPGIVRILATWVDMTDEEIVQIDTIEFQPGDFHRLDNFGLSLGAYNKHKGVGKE